MLCRIEVPDAGPLSLYAQHTLHLAVLHLDERPFLPLCVEDGPADEYLVGRHTLPGALAAQLGHEVRGGGVQRTDTPVVEHGQLPYLVCRFAVHPGGSSLCRTGQDEEERQRGTHGLVQQTAYARAPGGEGQEESGEQQQVARVGDGYAPGVGGYEQVGAPSVRVAGRLVEPVTACLTDVVHGDALFLLVSLPLHHDMGTVVHRGIGAGVGYLLKVAEAEGERQGARCTVFVGEGRGGLPLAQVQGTLLRREAGQQSPQQDDHEGEVQEQDREAAECLPLQQVAY